MLALLSVSLVAIFTEFAYAQVRFARTYGGTNWEWGFSVQQTSDGGYIVAGSTFSFTAVPGYSDFLLIKTDAFGNVQWAKTYGGTYADGATSVQQTSDGGYIVVGTTGSFGVGWEDILLIKTDAFGNIQWAKTYGGANHRDYGYSVQQTSDGGYIVLGKRETPDSEDWWILLIKTYANGNVQWVKTYVGEGKYSAYSVQQTSDGGYILAGEKYIFVDDGGDDYFAFSVSDYDALLIKTDANGNVQWAKIYGGTDYDYATSVQQTSDGGYIVAGRTYSFDGGGWKVFLIKTYANGNLQWAKAYFGGWPESVRQTSDGGYILSGYIYIGPWPNYDIFLIKTYANGNVQWAKIYGGGNRDEIGFVQQTSDGGYIVVGTTESFGADGDIFLIKTDANGNIGSCGIVRNVTPPVNTVSPTVTTPSIYAYSPSLGVTSPSPNVTSITPAVTAPCPLSDDNELGISESCKPVSGLITPYKGGIKVSGSGEFEVKVYNVSGIMVKSVKGTNEVKLELSRGVYFVEVVSGGKVIREKVIIR
jgi:hypothetical protein